METNSSKVIKVPDATAKKRNSHRKIAHVVREVRGWPAVTIDVEIARRLAIVPYLDYAIQELDQGRLIIMFFRKTGGLDNG